MFLNRRKAFQCFHKNLVTVKNYQHQSENEALNLIFYPVKLPFGNRNSSVDSKKCEATVTNDSNIMWNEVRSSSKLCFHNFPIIS